ncbi:MAG TPA: MBL fold metallo-hydrolase [Ruminococcaceae bacterium]|nr:MBL fold metallo-hydrolase [Oscillospiraceae bacterium]
MKRIGMPLGQYGANCYVLIDEATKQACVIDPGVMCEELRQALDGCDLKYILLTHGHFDHIFGVNGLRELYPNAQVAIHKDDEICLTDPEYNLAGDVELPESVRDMKADIVWNGGECLPFADTELEVIHTPGHSLGSVCYFDRKNLALYSGDTLFCLTVGRTDFLGGDFDTLMDSLHKLLVLADETDVFPGHNRATTIGFEKKRNRYMRKMS